MLKALLLLAASSALVSAEPSRTLIFVRYPGSVIGSDQLYIQGSNADEESSDVRINLARKNPSVYPEYRGLSKGVDKLSWDTQYYKQHQGRVPNRDGYGVPAIYTTNGRYDYYFNSDNAKYRVGPDAWLIDVEMECDDTITDGWFKFSAHVQPSGASRPAKEEGPIEQAFRPADEASVHFGRCGYVNVFDFGKSEYVNFHLPNHKYHTIVMVKKEPNVKGEDLFIRGWRAGCNDASEDCEVPISIRAPDAKKWPAANTWSQGVTSLSPLDNANEQQAQYNGQNALGVPLFRTSNRWLSPQHWPANIYGDNYWVLEVDMDCSVLPEQWFAFQVFVAKEGELTEFEGPIKQLYAEEFDNPVHYGRCDDTNIYTFNENDFLSIWYLAATIDTLVNGED